MYKAYIDRTLFKGSKTLRRIDFRIDTQGVYLLFYQGDVLAAGISYQYHWNKSIHLVPGWSFFSWNAQRHQEIFDIMGV